MKFLTFYRNQISVNVLTNASLASILSQFDPFYPSHNLTKNCINIIKDTSSQLNLNTFMMSFVSRVGGHIGLCSEMFRISNSIIYPAPIPVTVRSEV